jgi:quinol monooxygenase YgiN
MVTVIVRFRVVEGKEEEALAAMSKMADAVLANEPGVLAYTFNRGRVDPREYYIYELYDSEESFAEHNKTEHMKELQVAFASVMDRATFNVEMLEQVAGFVRRA